MSVAGEEAVYTKANGLRGFSGSMLGRNSKIHFYREAEITLS